ncbi:MAG TPA: prolipoprotein diacylglyceryl transferase family protein [Anaerolineaceae bacterium]
MNIFSVWTALGILAGLVTLAQRAVINQRTRAITHGVSVLVWGLAGSRLVHAALNWEYYRNHLIEIPQVWLGGLAWEGMLAGVCLGWIILAYSSRFSLGYLLDELYPLLPPLAVCSWLGCWMVGTAYGMALPEGTWWGISARDESGEFARRFPLQPLAAFTLAAYFWFIDSHRPRRAPAGLLGGLALAGFALGMAGFTSLRADYAPAWQGLRIETWVAAVFAGIFMGFTLLIWFFRKRTPKRLYKP